MQFARQQPAKHWRDEHFGAEGVVFASDAGKAKQYFAVADRDEAYDTVFRTSCCNYYEMIGPFLGLFFAALSRFRRLDRYSAGFAHKNRTTPAVQTVLRS